MTDVIGSAIIMIATLIIVSVLIAVLFPNVFNVAGSIKTTAGNAGDRLATSGTVVNYDAAGNAIVLDLVNNGKSSLPVTTINQTVAYLGSAADPEGRLSLGPDGQKRYWGYAIAGGNGSSWDPGKTLVVTVVSPEDNFTPGDYRFRMLLYNGATIEYGFTIDE